MLANVTAVEFDGPAFITLQYYTDYYFICRLTLSVSDTTSVFDVALTFDGELDSTFKTTTAAALEVTFTPRDFGQHFGQTVTYVSH